MKKNPLTYILFYLEFINTCNENKYYHTVLIAKKVTTRIWIQLFQFIMNEQNTKIPKSQILYIYLLNDIIHLYTV